MRKEQKFIRSMVITGVVGLSIMMITMLYIIKMFGTKKAEVANESIIPNRPIQSESVKLNKTLEGVIHEKNSYTNKIKVWDIQASEYIKMQIKDKTQLENSYGKAMSLDEVQIGDLVEITYEVKSKDAVTIKKSARAWTKTDISNIDINPQSNQITIGNTKYDYTSNMTIVDDLLETLSISHIGEFDTLKIQGIDQTIWSIQVLQSPGYLKLLNLPTQEGTIEIGNNRVYTIEEVADKIPLSPGQHKIVIKMDGYIPFADQVDIVQDLVYEIDLKETEKAVCSLEIQVTNPSADYKVHISNKVYKKGDVIRLEVGTYDLEIRADKFHTFQEKIQVKTGDQQIRVNLEAKVEEKPEETGPVKTEKPVEKEKEEIKTVQIIIETEPSQAQVFVSGVYKGTTPALTGLKPGEYDISIEKEGYTTLYTTIVIDGANKQKGFLYTLQKE